MKAKKSHYRLPVVAALLLIMTSQETNAINLKSYEPDDSADALLYSQATSEPETTEEKEKEKPEE